MLQLSYSDNKQFILKWNELYPLDHWWRKKYNVAFNSPQHRSVSHIDMYYDWLEENMFKDYIETVQIENEKIKIYNETGQWLHVDVEKTKSALIDKFDKIDISAFNFNVEPDKNLEQDSTI